MDGLFSVVGELTRLCNISFSSHLSIYAINCTPSITIALVLFMSFVSLLRDGIAGQVASLNLMMR